MTVALQTRKALAIINNLYWLPSSFHINAVYIHFLIIMNIEKFSNANGKKGVLVFFDAVTTNIWNSPFSNINGKKRDLFPSSRRYKFINFLWQVSRQNS